ncbi:MAG: hypothetical protein NTX49_08125 [Chlamydiae bacterium]|nr:hypothetical protein [Chlamydiota bacterium]
MPAAPGPPGPPGPPVQPTPSIQPTGQLTVGRGRVKVIVVDPATKMARVKIDKEYFNVSLDKLNTSSTDMEDVAQRVVLIIDQLLLGEVHDAGGDCTHQGIFDPTTTASLVLRGPIPSVPTTGGTSSTEPRPVLVSNFNLIEITDTGTTTPPRSGTLKMGNPGTATAFKVIAVFGAVVASPAAEAAVHPASTARPPAGQQPLLSSSAASGQIAPAAAPGQGGQGGGGTPPPANGPATGQPPELPLQQQRAPAAEAAVHPASTSGTPAPVQQQQQQPAPEPVAHPPAPLLPLSSSSAAAAAPSQAPIAPAQTGEERYQPPGLQHTSAPNPLTADPPPAPAQGLNLFSRNVSASDLVMGREKKTGTLLYKDSTEAPTSGSTAAPGLPLQQPAGGPPPASTAHRSPAGRMGGTGGGGGGPPLPLAPAQPPGPAGGQASATVPPELAAAAGGQVGGTPVAAASASVLPFDQQQRRAPPPPSVTAAAAPDSATSEVPGPGGGTPAAHPAAPEPAPLPLPQQQPLASAAALTPGGGGTPAPAPVTELEPPPPVPPATVPPVALTPEGVGSLTSGSVLPPAAASAAARGPATVQQLRAEIQTLFFQLIPDLSKLEGAEKTSLDRLISKTGRGAQEMGVEALIDTIQGKEDLKEKLKIIWTIIKAAHPTATPAEAIQLLRTGIEIAQTSAALRTKTRPSWANLLIPVPRSHSQTIIRKDSKAEELAAANTMYNALMSLQLEQQPPVTAASAAAAPAPPPQETAQRRDSVSEASPPLTLTASSPEAAAPTAAAGAAAALPQTPLLPLSSSSAASEPAPTIQTLTAGIQNLFFQLIPDLSKLKGPVLSKLEGAEKTSLDRLISKTGPTAKAMGIEALIDMIEGKEELKGKLKTIWTIIKAAHPTANPAEAIQLLRTGIEIAQTSADKRTTRKHLWANLLTPVPPSNSGTKGKEAKLKAELAELAAADAMYKALYELKTSQATAAHVPPALPPPPQQQQQPVSAAAAAASTPAPGGGTPAASAAPRQGQGGGGGPTSAHVAPAAAALPPLPPGSGQQHTSAPAPGHVAPVTAPTPAPVLSAAAAPSAAASPPAASASGPAAAGGMGGGQASATPTALEASALAAEALVTAVAPAPTRPLSETPPLPIAPEHLQQTAQTRDSVPEVPPLLPQSPQYSTGTGSSLSPPPTPLPGEQTPTALGDHISSSISL